MSNNQQAQSLQHYEDWLTQAVEEGKLTEDQKTKLLDKAKELQSQHEDEKEGNQDKTPKDRHLEMEKKHTELEQWAGDNNIPIAFLPRPLHSGHLRQLP